MSAFHFLRPFWLLALIPTVLLWWTLWRQGDRVAAWGKMIDPALLEHLLVGEDRRGLWQPITLLLAVWLACVCALAGPSWRLQPSPFAEEEAGLMIVLKVTESMLATDVQPSRLERAKLKISDLLERRAGAPTGVIVYSGSDHLVMPLTTDQRIMTMMLADLTPDLMPAAGDVLPAALSRAEQMIRASSGRGSVLVVADTASEAAIAGVAKAADIPVQVLALTAFGSEPDSGLKRAAQRLGARLRVLTVDAADVDALSSRASRVVSVASVAGDGQRWADAGYGFLPFIALGLLMWFRKGWVIE